MTLIPVLKQQPDDAVPFGHPMRSIHFPCFDKAYVPLNHGSFGAFPKAVRDRQRELQDQTEARADYFIRYIFPDLLNQAREAVAPLLGVATDEVVFIPNVTTGMNTVLRSLEFEVGDVILHFSTDYDANYKTIDYICESTPAEQLLIEIDYPIEDDEIVERFRDMVEMVNRVGSQKVKIALFDTVVAFPGVRMPWEALVRACREFGVLSLIDGAHGIGHIDLTGLGEVGPDFFTSNCYKWLYVPRGCAVLHVPFRNHHLIRTCLPTSWGYQAAKPSSQSSIQRKPDPMNIPEASSSSSSSENRTNFPELFAFVATVDTTPYLCVLEALRFRQVVCGGEESIRQYCQDIAQIGGRRVAQILGTEVMQNSTRTLTNCSFVNVRLPLTFSTSSPAAATDYSLLPQSNNNNGGDDDDDHGDDDDDDAALPVVVVGGSAGLEITSRHELDDDNDTKAAGRNPINNKNKNKKKEKKKEKQKQKKILLNREDAPAIVRWIIDRALINFDIPIMTKFHAGAIWIRLSGQIYIQLQDFERAAEVLKGLCDQVNNNNNIWKLNRNGWEVAGEGGKIR